MKEERDRQQFKFWLIGTVYPLILFGMFYAEGSATLPVALMTVSAVLASLGASSIAYANYKRQEKLTC